MRIIENPARATWKELTERPQLELEFLESSVRNILNRVRVSGDAALIEFTEKFDHAKVETLGVTDAEVTYGAGLLSPELKNAITMAAANIEKFHKVQKRPVIEIETMPGVLCWRKEGPISRIGIYIPGGTAPLFSTVLMLGIPAKLAGCKDVVLCSPPGPDGRIHPAILFAARLAGITQIFKVGGAQAIGALAYGTESIPAVHKIFGPGNQYVTKAKLVVNQQGTAIDMPAGPSEVMVIADAKSNPSFIAADLLSQAEHGADSQVVLLSQDRAGIEAILKAIDVQIENLPRKEMARLALANSLAILFSASADMMDFANEYAPEHLIINTENCDALANEVKHAGSVFLGPFSPESAGDYASGTNHTLPTNGFAKAYSGISLESFTKTITYQKISEAGIRNLGPLVEIMAEAEELLGHKESISVRLRSLQ